MAAPIWISVSWSVLKAFADDRELAIQYIDEGNHYLIRSNDDGYGMECKIFKAEEAADAADFETNYMPTANAKIIDRDIDGSPFSRVKVTKLGWHYSPRSINWSTCTHNSLKNTDCQGNDLGDAGVRFFDDTDTELVQGNGESDVDFQARLDSDCVKTVMWYLNLTQPYDIIGAVFSVQSAPTNDTYAFLTVAPDIPAELGGMVPFCDGGVNLAMMLDKQPVYLNGRGTTTLYPDPDYHSNEQWLVINHPVGQKTKCQIIYELYKE